MTGVLDQKQLSIYHSLSFKIFIISLIPTYLVATFSKAVHFNMVYYFKMSTTDHKYVRYDETERTNWYSIVSTATCIKVDLCWSQDIGCGVGGPARTIAKETGANVVGLNICEYQLKRARMHTEKAGLQSQVSFTKVNVYNM